MGNFVMKEFQLGVRDEIVEIIDAVEEFIKADTRLNSLGVNTTDRVSDIVGDAIVARLQELSPTPDENQYMLLKLVELLGKYN